MPETTLTQITDHVFWMSPGQPDRPSLAIVVGEDYSLMLDAGASAAHARLFLEEIAASGVSAPRYVALTHWHWDHIFGAAEIRAPVIAHAATAERLAVLSGYDWGDAALDQRVLTGAEIIACANDIKLELPEPREIHIVQPEIVFASSLEFRLGGVTCSIHHVGGDHAPDACVMHIVPDRVLFLGDCLYDAIYTPQRHYTVKNTLPLLDALAQFDADIFIEGHSADPLTRSDFAALTHQIRLAGTLVEQYDADETSIIAAAQRQVTVDDDLREFVQAFIAGRAFEKNSPSG